MDENNLLSGYLGFAKYPNRTLKSSSTIYLASDISRGEVFVIPLTIGCFSDMYRVISDLVISGARIRIIPISIQYDYLSDIYNIVMEFLLKGIDINWIFPDRPTEYYTEEFETSQILASSYSNQIDPSITVEFVDSGRAKLYDIKLMTNLYTKYFTLFLTAEKHAQLCSNTMIDEIHLDAYKSRHGGIDGFELLSLNIVSEKDRIMNLRNSSDYFYLQNKVTIGYDKERWSN